jgi:hypothetical protein
MSDFRTLRKAVINRASFAGRNQTLPISEAATKPEFARSLPADPCRVRVSFSALRISLNRGKRAEQRICEKRAGRDESASPRRGHLHLRLRSEGWKGHEIAAPAAHVYLNITLTPNATRI